LLTRLPFKEEITFPVSEETSALLAQLLPHGECNRDNGTYSFHPRSGFKLSAFYTIAEGMKLPPALFSYRRPTLEALFLHLTGHALRE